MNDKEKLEAIEKVIPKARLTTGLTVGNAHNCTSSYIIEEIRKILEED